MGGKGLTSPQIRHCCPAILTKIHFFSVSLFRQALFGVCCLGLQADWRAADASLSIMIGQRSDVPQIFDIQGSWRAVVAQSRRERPHRFCPVHGESPKRWIGSPLRQLSEGGTRTIFHEQLLHDMSKADSRLVRFVGGSKHLYRALFMH